LVIGYWLLVIGYWLFVIQTQIADSIFTPTPVPSHLLGSELGQLKLERYFN